jgi:serine/threonine protein kinase/tetratricopeptide (TPR) repeat protein
MPADLKKARDLFLHAVGKLPPEEWDGYVAEACGEDAELLAQVGQLLQVHREAGSFLDRPAAAGAVDDNASGAGATARQLLDLPAAGGTVDEPADGAGTIIAGRYKLLQKIGEGGMGSVWMADQAEPIKRRVAVKLIRVERGQSRTILLRFEAERQAIALMDHPHIARLLDAGEAAPAHAGDAPRPFFVMELVKGVPLTDYCDAHRLGIPERLRLFMQVCAAVQHAHQKGIIHRDLKPSNVLVESHDGKAVPKVIDFGLAKAITGLQLTEHTLFTAFGSVMGTPLYMAPEQAGASALDVDTRADIYALGIILYELLTGTTPITRETLRKAALDEMLKLIREQEVPTPSSRLSSTESAPSVAANRQTEPAKLGRVVKGELDWIVLKALAKERDRRYETANGFAQDIERFLNHEPLTAGPPTVAYRLRKFVRRNRGPVVAAGLIVLTLVVGIAGTAWGLLQAERHAKQTRDERDAKDLALKAEQQARADETTARQHAFAALRSMTADVVERKFGQGKALTEDDRAFLRGVIGQYDAFAAIKADDPESRVMRAEGRHHVANMRFRLGQLPEAEKNYDDAVGLLKQLVADFPSRREFRGDLAQCYKNRAALLAATGRPQESERDYDKSLTILKQLAADFPDRQDVRRALATFYNNRGVLLATTGRLNEALQHYDQAVSIHAQLAADVSDRPEERHSLAQGHINRGNLLRNMNRLPEAGQDYAKALGILKQLTAEFTSRPEFRQQLAKCHNNRGNLLKDAGQFKEAEQDYDEALSIKKQLVADFPGLPEFRQDLAQSHMNRSALLIDVKRLPEAEVECDQALSIYKKLATDFPNQPDVRNELAAALMNLAIVHKQRGQWAAAKRRLLEGQPHHLAALSANPRHPIYRQQYHDHLNVLAEVQAGLLEQQDAVRTAETLRDLGWDAPVDAYNAACALSLCIPVVAKHDKLDDKQRKEAVQFYGDAAMKLLREAVSKGWKDAAHMKKDTDLNSLHQRDDFKKLLAALEAAPGGRGDGPRSVQPGGH